MINPREEQSIRDRAGDMVLTWYAEHRGSVDTLEADGYLDLVAAASIAVEESDFALRRWVSGARRAGVSWESLGATMGTSRQAAQKRFGTDRDRETGSVHDDATMVARRGVTAFNEVDVLREEGAAGRQVVRAGLGQLHFIEVGHPVEHLRVAALRQGRLIEEREAEGWQHCFTWYPFTYFARPAEQG